MSNLTDLGLVEIVDTEEVNDWPVRINALLNALAAIRWRGSDFAAGVSAAMAVIGTDVGGLARVANVVLDRQCRVKITCSAAIEPAGTIARYELRCAYNVGAYNLAAAVLVGQPTEIALDVAVGRPRSGMVTATVLLAAGTYTFYVVGRRQSGGAGTDTLSTATTIVEVVSLV